MLRKVLLAAFAAALFSAALLPQAGLASGRVSGATWTVNDDISGKGKCKSPNFSTIQGAVDAAAPGDTIVVCAGVYGSTSVDKQLTISGPGSRLGTAPCADAVKNPANGGSAAVISGGVAPGFAVSGDHVSISGVTIQDADIGVKVTGDSVADTQVINSVIQNNTMGLYLRGQSGQFAKNCIRNNTRAGSASGNGMYSDPGVAVQGTTIFGNAFFGNPSAAVNLNGDGSGSASYLTIKNNSSSNDGDFVSLAGTQHVQILKNNVPGTDGGSVVFVQAGNFDTKIQDNTFSGGEEGVNFNANGDQPNLFAIVSGNTLTGNGAGILVLPESLNNGLIYRNTVKKNELGVLLAPANYVQVVGNKLNGNSSADCLDFNPLGETTLWHDNTGDTENQDGLCDGAVVLP